jgi:biopolymer transport protein ExbB
MKRIIAVLMMLSLAAPLAAQQADNSKQELGELLELVRQGKVRDSQQQRERLDSFIEQRNEQDRLLEERRQRLTELENDVESMETRFDENETEITELEERLDERSGELKELFGVLQQVGSDVRGTLQNSPTSSQYEGRADFLQTLIEKAGSSSKLPSITELEELWYRMQEEMIASGEISRYDAPVVEDDGTTREQPVIRVGTFNVVSDEGQYLNWEADTQKLVELPRQPAGRYVSAAGEFVNAEPGIREDFWVDPSGGSLLSLLLQAPDFRERIDQGGIIGYIIIGLGIFALLLTLERLISLGIITMKVNRQAKSDTPDPGNPLGLVMQVYQQNKHKDSETLELKLGESIVQESPKLTRFLAVLKIVAVVAPLLGLLGTVTGMINTFQAITLFGTGDPKLMAGGISQALVTTVMGLSVAIPTVLLHTVVQGRSKRLSQLLEERSIGIIARRDEGGDEEPAAQGA